MYHLRVLIGGDIYIMRSCDSVFGRYKADGTPVYGCTNKLGFEPYQVKQLAEEAQAQWFEEKIYPRLG